MKAVFWIEENLRT
ncbi:Protein of unknown function [Bacillus cereus]|nr:Protein of unknown function [Bacillus cereus]